MDIIQGWSITTLSGKLSLNAVRVLIKIVEYVQSPLRGQLASKYLGRVYPHSWGDEVVSIPVRYILPQGSNHYSLVYDACQELRSVPVNIYDEQQCRWYTGGLILQARYTAKSGIVDIMVSRYIIDRILDFTRAFSRYNLECAMELPTSYSARLYMLMCSSQRPTTWSIDNLKDMLGCADRYRLNADFVKRVLEPARAVLETRRLNGFAYKLIREGRKFTSVQLIPIKRQNQTEGQLAARAGLTAWCDADLRTYLQQQCGFTAKELAAHKILLTNFAQLPAYPDRLFEICERKRKKGMNKGYIINALKSTLQEYNGTPWAKR